MSQQGLSKADSWSSATSLDRFIPPTITRPLPTMCRISPGERLQFQVEFFSPSVQCHCSWQIQHTPDSLPQAIHNGQIINTNYSSTLIIEPVTLQCQGLYMFVVENVYGRVMTQTEVIIERDSVKDDRSGLFTYFATEHIDIYEIFFHSFKKFNKTNRNS